MLSYFWLNLSVPFALQKFFFITAVEEVRALLDMNKMVISVPFSCRRLKPGGGGVNAAIFSAAGESLHHATKKCADALRPGTSVVVPLPSISPLHQREGVTHVIHVLGPNMNPMRPDYLKNDYIKGSKILREAYNSLFENFASIVRGHMGKQNGKLGAEMSASGGTSPNDTKMKREDSHGSERMKKHKLLPPIMTAKQQHEHTKANTPNYHDKSMTSSAAPNQAREGDTEKSGEVASKTWGSWARTLYELAMHPEKYKNTDSILETSDEFIVLKDLYPKVYYQFFYLYTNFYFVFLCYTQ